MKNDKVKLKINVFAGAYRIFSLFNFPFSIVGGYAALVMTLSVIFASLALIGALAFFSLQEVAQNRAYSKSIASHYVSEGGVEDALWRVVSGKQISGNENVGVGAGTATLTLTTGADGSRVVRSQGAFGNSQQNVETRVGITTDAVSFFYGVQIGDGGMVMGNNSQINGNAYSNGSITGSGTVTGTATVAGGISDSPSVEYPAGCAAVCGNADFYFASTTPSRDSAQSFTASASGALNKISAYLGKIGSPSSDLTMRITADVSGHPNRTSIASTALPASMVGATPSWIDLSFASPPTLTNGTKYWIVLDSGTSSGTNYWNWRRDATDGYAGNTGKYTSDWSSSSAVWTNAGGDLAFRVWIGGVNTQIGGITIGNSTSGTGRANLFNGTTVHGSVCPNQYCVVENPLRGAMPISDGVIQDWKNEASVSPGHTCGIADGCDGGGDLTIASGASKTIGPMKISGNLSVSSNAHLSLSGTVWVAGTADLSNNCTVGLSSGYGSNSGVMVVDGTVDVSNGCVFSGSGTAGSYILMLSTKNAPASQVMDISNNATGVIYYAAGGRIHFNGNAAAKEVTAYGFDLDNGATITYESGLQNIHFSSGPGAGYDIKYWKQVE